MKILAVATILAAASLPSPITIRLAHGTPRERQTQARLETVLATTDLRRHTFTQDVLIQEAAVPQPFPVLTLGTRFADSSDDLLSSYLHEQLYWYLSTRAVEQQGAVGELRWMYPIVPVGLPVGAETADDTYAQLVHCDLELQADREIIGVERTAVVVERKPRYTWVYATAMADRARLDAVVVRHGLEIK